MFFRLFLIFLVAFLVIRFLQSLFRPVQAKKYSSNSTNQSSYSKKEGEVTIIKGSSDSDKKIRKDEGDYVDYEEV